MEKKTVGTVISVKKQWWIKINTKPFRIHALDGAMFPHIITVSYVVDGQEYTKKKWIRALQECPVLNAQVTVIYREDQPMKCRVELNEKNHDRPMKEVILSADGDLSLYLVPADVADNLVDVCNEFASEYVWHGPNSGKFLRLYGKQYVACFTEADFIDYLNEYLYPQFKSVKLRTLGSFDDGVPAQYQNLPWFNF